MKIILLGLPGSGKGTQAKILTQNLKIPHISTGNLLRKAYTEKSELGLLAHQYMSKGELVPDEVTIGITIQRLNISDCNNGFLLDGFPRNLYQANALKEHLNSRNKKIDRVIYIKVDERILLERLTGRRVCSGCSETFHLVSNPSKKAGQCDFCGAILIQRDDDQEETVKERLSVNGKLTDQLVKYYGEQGILKTVNGLNNINEVAQDIRNALRK